MRQTSLVACSSPHTLTAMGSTSSRVAAGGVAAAAVTALALAVRQQRHDRRGSLAAAAVSSAPRRSLPLAGLRIMVTGASQGIGLAVLRRLRMDGAHVVGVSRRAASEAAAAEACAGDAPAGGLSWIAADVSRMEDVEACVRQAGELDGLVNNAGIAELEPVLDMTPGAWDRVLATNLRAPAFLTQVRLALACALGAPHVETTKRVRGVAIAGVRKAGTAPWRAWQRRQRELHRIHRRAGKPRRLLLVQGGSGHAHQVLRHRAGAARHPCQRREPDGDADADGRKGVGRRGGGCADAEQGAAAPVRGPGRGCGRGGVAS